MAAVQKALPGLRLRLITAVWQDEFSAAEADVEIRFGSAEVAGRGATPLGSFDLVAVAAPALGGRWETVASLPLIQPVGVTETWARILRQSGMTQDIEPAIFTDSHGLAVDLALSGAGVALTSAIIAAPALADGRLVDLGPARIRGSEGYFLAVSDPGNAPAVAFADWLRAAIMSR